MGTTMSGFRVLVNYHGARAMSDGLVTPPFAVHLIDMEPDYGYFARGKRTLLQFVRETVNTTLCNGSREKEGEHDGSPEEDKEREKQHLEEHERERKEKE